MRDETDQAEQEWISSVIAENSRLRDENDRLREEVEVMILGDRLRAERDRLREVLKAAQADIAEWMETYVSDPGWRRSLVVMDQIETALKEKTT